ncbi:3-phenylpropionate/cinnamic acid dioxygenase subunit beta [Amycolatopsis anabasis]|uniref:3-phenylpropionate/cinnamic acid dioxygenase subunit beta n=1 Tax=Amycolatopsis anabasis TaxID=1840409 RepID=UPI00131AA105|nr:3-phenylpropionate/cinnamic acid dioxygenase subunit beta [Amycolatopsis anabasis]
MTAFTDPVVSTQAYRPRPDDAPAVRPPRRVPPAVLHEVEQFLYFEAQLLDEARYNDWFDLIADDVHYFMPVRRNRLHRDLLAETSGLDEFNHYDDNKMTLALRVKRLQQPTAWSDNPPARTARSITNITAEPTDADGEYRVRSVFHLYRNRLADDADSYSGRRTDTLRAHPDLGFQIVNRTIHLAESVVQANNLGLFF